MTDSILRSYYNVSSSTFVPFAVTVPRLPGANGLLTGETQGFAIDATSEFGTVSVIDTGTPAHNLSNVILDASNISQSGTSPKLTLWNAAPLARWSPHNYFLNSGSPATQNVTLVTGFVYTYGITGTGSLAGTSGASGTATAGSPVTFTATGTTGTFTVTGSPSTMWINRGPTSTAYLTTTGSIRYGIPQQYDTAESQFGILTEESKTNLCLFSDDLTNAAWTKSNMSTAKTATGPDGGTNSATTITASAGNATALQAITSGSADRVTSVWIIRRTGSGNIDLTQDNGGTWTTQSVTGTWTRFSLSTVTSANPTIGIRVVTNGDAVDVFGFQHESGTQFVSSTIPTVGSGVTRANDRISGSVSLIPYGSANSMYLSAKTPIINSQHNVMEFDLNDATGNEQALLYTASDASAEFFLRDGGAVQANIDSLQNISANVLFQMSAGWGLNDADVSVDGSAVQVDNVATMPTPTSMSFGSDDNNQFFLNGYIYKFIAVPHQVQTDTANLSTWRYNF